MRARSAISRVVFLWILYAAMAAAVSWFVFDANRARTPETVAYSELLAAVDRGEVTEVRIAERELTGTLAKARPSGATRIVANRLPSIDETQLLSRMEKRGVKFAGSLPTSSTWVYLASSLLPFAILAATFITSSLSSTCTIVRPALNADARRVAACNASPATSAKFTGQERASQPAYACFRARRR